MLLYFLYQGTQVAALPVSCVLVVVYLVMYSYAFANFNVIFRVAWCCSTSHAFLDEEFSPRLIIHS